MRMHGLASSNSSASLNLLPLASQSESFVTEESRSSEPAQRGTNEEAEVQEAWAKLRDWLEDNGGDDPLTMMRLVLHGQVRDRVSLSRELRHISQKLEKLQFRQDRIFSSTALQSPKPKKCTSHSWELNRQLLSTATLDFQRRDRLQSSSSHAVKFSAVLAQPDVEPPQDVTDVVEAPPTGDLVHCQPQDLDSPVRRSRSTKDLINERDKQICSTVVKKLSNCPEEDSSVHREESPPLCWHLVGSWLMEKMLVVCGVPAVMWHCGSGVEWSKKIYHWLLVVILLVIALSNSFQLVVCDAKPALVEGLCSSTQAGLCTDFGLAVGAFTCLWFFGGARLYQQRTDMLRDARSVLIALLADSNLLNSWHRVIGVDAFVALFFWLVLVGGRALLLITAGDMDIFSIQAYVGFVLSVSVLTSAGFLQMSTWRGLSLRIESFIEPFLKNKVNCQQMKDQWRLLGACMRTTSRTYQMSSIVAGATTVLCAVAFLIDLQRGHMLVSTPALFFCLLL
ncbi:PYK, partial [Symbiodinium sp. CCMP2592]